MKRERLPRIVLALLLLAVCRVTSAVAQPLSTGEDPSKPHTITDHPTILGGCRALWFGSGSGDEIVRLGGLGLTITQTLAPSDLAIANLVNYDILVVAFTRPGVIGAFQPDIQLFVSMGHGLLVHQPNAVGLMDYTPTGFDVNIADVFWCGGSGTSNYIATIVNGGHPITSGLTDADLSGDFDSAGALGASFTVLTVNTVCATPALAAGSYGSGRVAFETGNAATTAFVPGTDAYWGHIFNWLCTITPPVSTEPSNWGKVKASYR